MQVRLTDMRRFSQRSALVTLERDQHHAAAGPGVRAADHLRHHHAAAGAEHEPEAAQGRPARPQDRAKRTSARSRSARRAVTGWTRCRCPWPNSKASWCGISARTRTWWFIFAPIGTSPLEYFAAVTDACQRHGISRYLAAHRTAANADGPTAKEMLRRFGRSSPAAGGDSGGRAGLPGLEEQARTICRCSISSR